MITILVMDVKSFQKRHFGGFQYTIFKNKLIFIKKICTAYNNPMHCKARQVLWDLFSINQGNGSELTSVAEATKVNLKNLKT